MTSRFYVLSGKRAVESTPEASIEWRLANHRDCIVGHEWVGDSLISTVFMGYNMEYPHGTPAIFETLVIGGAMNGYIDRHSTWDMAETGHRAAVLKVCVQAK